MTQRRSSTVLWLLVSALVALGLGVSYFHFAWRVDAQSLAWGWSGHEYELTAPRWLGLVLVLPLLMLGSMRSLADLPPLQRGLLLAARGLFFVLLAVALAKPVRAVDTARVATVVLIDVSDSVARESLERARTTIDAMRRARAEEDRIEVVTFAARPRSLPVPEGERIPSAEQLRHPPGRESAATDIEAALRFAHGLVPPGYLKRLVVLSDGRETSGDVLSEATRARELGAKIFTVPYRNPPPGEVAVSALDLPERVDVGQSFKVVGRVYASRPTKARARLYQGQTLNGLDGVREVQLEPGQNKLEFESVVRVGGEVTYRLELDRIGVDRFAENNRFASTIEVPGRPRVLLVDGQPSGARYLAGALAAHQFDVETRGPVAFPGSLQELARYDFVVVSDLPKEALRLEAQALIERYVRDLGGGFLFAGGEQGFGLGGWGDTTMERLLPVRMDVQRRRDTPSVAMVLVIDRSGSMSGPPMEMAKAACRATLETLSGDDLIEVIAFDSTPKRYVRTQPARYRTRIQNEIAAIQPGGGTEVFRALDMAYQDVSVVQARKKHVVLLTDGQASKEGVIELVRAMVSEAITVTTVGLGAGVDRPFLRSIAEAGGGRYHDVPDPANLPRIFTRETEMVARQAAVEEWFPVQPVAPADFLKGVAIGSAPLLHGYVATELKPPPAQLILASDRGEPILARWRVGLGHALAWTSDVKNHWAVDWLTWSGFSKFWGQLVREHMRHERRQEIDMETEVVGDEIRAVVDAFTPAERFENDLVSRLTLRGPFPSSREREVAMRQTAPGRYEARFRADEYGSFLLRAEHRPDGTSSGRTEARVSFGRVSNPYPHEYSSFAPDLDRMTRLAVLGAGAVDPLPGTVYDPAGARVRYHTALWSRAVLAALAVLLIDLLLRRVRLFDRRFVRTRAS